MKPLFKVEMRFACDKNNMQTKLTAPRERLADNLFDGLVHGEAREEPSPPR